MTKVRVITSNFDGKKTEHWLSTSVYIDNEKQLSVLDIAYTISVDKPETLAITLMDGETKLEYKKLYYGEIDNIKISYVKSWKEFLEAYR